MDFGYTITGADLTKATTAALYWSADTTFDAGDTLITDSVTPTQTAQAPPDKPVPVHIDATALQNTPPPTGTKYLLAVVDPENKVAESDEPKYPNDFGANNVKALGVPDIKIATVTLITPGLVSLLYQIDRADGADDPLPRPLEVRLFWSKDKSLGSGDKAASDLLVLSNPNDLTPGFHLRMVKMSSPPPTVRHYLLAAVDPSMKLVESDKTNNLEWVSPDTGQSGYGVAPMNLRRALTNPRAWTNEALRRLKEMKEFLGTGYVVNLGSIIKPGEHKTYEKMDVFVGGRTSWEQLALAAAKAGFWVHAEGVKLAGIDWPLSPLATGLHLDLYNIRPY